MKRKIKIFLSVLLLVFLVAVAGGLFYFKWAIKTHVSDSNKKMLFTIEEREGKVDISDRLLADGLIRSDYIFILAAQIKEKHILPGMYELSPNMNIIEILDKISSEKTQMAKVTIPEGYRIEQIARVLDKKGVVKYSDFVNNASDLEGKLFPDTYFFTKDESAEEVISSMTKDYEARITGANLTVTEDDLILASIVEKEAANDTDRGIIAGVYKNRINSGMKLQSDPTVSYARDSINLKNLSAKNQEDYEFWKPAKTAEFTSVISAYNTYQANSLPPAPICNPGLKSIEAALNPTASNYYYFLYDNNDKLYLASTVTGHEANKTKAFTN